MKPLWIVRCFCKDINEYLIDRVFRNPRFCNVSRSRAIATLSGLAIRLTCNCSAKILALCTKVFAKTLCWSALLPLSAFNNGCSENFAPHATTVATMAGWSGLSLPDTSIEDGEDEDVWSKKRERKEFGLNIGIRVCTIWKKTSTRSNANLQIREWIKAIVLIWSWMTLIDTIRLQVEKPHLPIQHSMACRIHFCEASYRCLIRQLFELSPRRRE